jgi:hypothetical protein
MLLLAGLAGALAWGLMRCQVTASSSGLDVVNGYRHHTYAWPQVLAVHLPRGAPFAVLDLADGTSCQALAIQSADGDRATLAVRQLRLLLARTAEDSIERPDPPGD